MTDLRATRSEACDVLVVGGGAAGVAAAVTSARQGLSVILLERYGFTGGGAVAGLSGTVCGMYLASKRHNAVPEKVVHGFLDDFIVAMERRSGLTEPVKYGLTWTRVHNPFSWKEVGDSLLLEAGVKVFFHTVVTGALLEGGDRVEGATAWSKEGPIEIRARVTIDASGDADLTAMAGLPTFIGANGRVQNPTMIFRLGGVDVGRFMATYGPDTIMPPSVSEMIQQANASGQYGLPRSKIWLFPTTQPNELLCNCTRVVGRDGRELLTILADDFTDAEIEGRRQTREYARFFRNKLVGCEQSFVIDTAPQVGVRQSRQIEGQAKLMNRDVVAGAKFKDGVARSPWPIELHSGEKPKVEWLLDDFYEVPFGAFVPLRGLGLLVAGRCLSAEHEAVASARVTAQCFSYGHAIGHAAFLAVRERVPTNEIDGRDVRMRLNQDGARLDA